MQERDILISPLDLSQAGEGYPNISAGHVSCMRGISPYLRWTCLTQGMDILISPLDMSHAREGYPNISAGPVSCRGWISLYLRRTHLMQERDILISPLDLSHAGDGYPHISAGPVSSKGWISLHLRWTGLILIKDIHQRTCIILRIWISLAESGTPLYMGDMQRPVHCYILQYPTELCEVVVFIICKVNCNVDVFFSRCFAC